MPLEVETWSVSILIQVRKIILKKGFDPVAETHATKWELLNMSVIRNEIMAYAISRQQLLLNRLALKICPV